mgnify:CR=1 FL=1
MGNHKGLNNFKDLRENCIIDDQYYKHFWKCFDRISFNEKLTYVQKCVSGVKGIPLSEDKNIYANEINKLRLRVKFHKPNRANNCVKVEFFKQTVSIPVASDEEMENDILS